MGSQYDILDSSKIVGYQMPTIAQLLFAHTLSPILQFQVPNYG